MKGIAFIDEPSRYRGGNVFSVHLSNVGNVDELFSQLNESLLFPSYFGFNWNALLDLLRDFSWIKQKTILLIHDDLPKLEAFDLKNYVEVLNNAIRGWKEDEDHVFEVIFPASAKGVIQKILENR